MPDATKPTKRVRNFAVPQPEPIDPVVAEEENNVAPVAADSAHVEVVNESKPIENGAGRGSVQHIVYYDTRDEKKAQMDYCSDLKYRLPNRPSASDALRLALEFCREAKKSEFETWLAERRDTTGFRQSKK